MYIPTLSRDIGTLMALLYGRQVTLTRSGGGEISVAEWDVPNVEQPIDLQSFFDENSYLLVEDVKRKLRVERMALLAATDWSQLADAPIDDVTKVQYNTYRQELRDISKQIGFPKGVIVWPQLAPAGTREADKVKVDSQQLGEDIPKTIEELQTEKEAQKL